MPPSLVEGKSLIYTIQSQPGVKLLQPLANWLPNLPVCSRSLACELMFECFHLLGWEGGEPQQPNFSSFSEAVGSVRLVESPGPLLSG